MEIHNILSATICFVCAFTFLLISQMAKSSVKPMNFWTSKNVDADTLLDVEAYNRDNCEMWQTYAYMWIATAFIILFHIKTGTFLIFLLCTAGLKWLIITYDKILKKYENVIE